MAIQKLNTIKEWFKTGLKPTQIQFWDTWDSFRHKNEKISVKDVEGIDEIFLSKADKSDFKTINGESLLGEGNIILENGASQNLQQTFNNGAIASLDNPENTNDSSEFYYNSSQIQLSQGYNTPDAINSEGSKFGAFNVAGGKPKIIYQEQLPEIGQSDIILGFENSTNSGTRTFLVPNKPYKGGEEPYILATKDDIPLYTPPTINDVLSNGIVAIDKSMIMFNEDKSYYLQLASSSLTLGKESDNSYLNLNYDSIHFSKDTTTTYYQNNKVRVSENGTQNKDFIFPNKPSGIHTLATLDDIDEALLFNSRTVIYSPVMPSALIRGGRIETNYFSTPGVNSTDLSVSTQATGINGTKGSNSISIGVNNRTDGNQSMTLGTANFTSSIDDIAIGAFNTTSGGYAISIGVSNSANLNVSGAFGDTNKLSGSGSGVYAIGRQNTLVSTNGANIVAGTYNNVTLGAGSSVFGTSNSGTTGMFSTVLGVGNNAPSFLETVLGTYATTYIPISTTAVDLTDRLFTIGNGVDNSNRSNALVMLKSGVTTLPTVTNALITAEPTGKVLITKEYLGTTGFTVNGTLIPLGGSMTFTAPTQLTITSKLTSAFSNSATTRNTVPGWSFAVTAGKTYKIEIIGAYQTAALTTGGSIGFILTGGAVGNIIGKMEGEILQTTVNTGVRTTIRSINDINTTAGSFMTTTGVGVINSPHYVGGILNFSCITSGTFEIQFASEVASSTAQLNTGSLLLVTEY